MHGFSIFGDCAARNIDIDFLELGDNRIIGKHMVRAFPIDHVPDAEPHRFG